MTPAEIAAKMVTQMPVSIHRKEILRGRTGAGEYLDTAQGYVTKEDCLAYGDRIARAVLAALELRK